MKNLLFIVIVLLVSIDTYAFQIKEVVVKGKYKILFDKDSDNIKYLYLTLKSQVAIGDTLAYKVKDFSEPIVYIEESSSYTVSKKSPMRLGIQEELVTTIQDYGLDYVIIGNTKFIINEEQNEYVKEYAILMLNSGEIESTPEVKIKIAFEKDDYNAKCLAVYLDGSSLGKGDEIAYVLKGDKLETIYVFEDNYDINESEYLFYNYELFELSDEEIKKIKKKGIEYIRINKQVIWFDKEDKKQQSIDINKVF